METMDEFFDKSKGSGKNVCPLCREAPTAIQLVIQAKDGVTPGSQPRSRSRSRNLCIECATDIFTEVENKLDGG